MKDYTAVIEKCPDTGLYVGYVPGFVGAHSQGETIDELVANLHEVVGMLLEDGEPQLEGEFIGTQHIGVVSMIDVPLHDLYENTLSIYFECLFQKKNSK